MDPAGLIPILAFVIPVLVGRQIVASAAAPLADSEKAALFPVSRTRQRLLWLVLPIIVALYLVSSPIAQWAVLATAFGFMVALELIALVQVRRLNVSEPFKRRFAIGASVSCVGVALAAAAIAWRAYAP